MQTILSSGHPRVDALAADIGHLPGVERVWLYGSRARGDAFQFSDYDLAVDAPELAPGVWFRILEKVEEAPILWHVDCIHLQKVPAELHKNVLEEGRVLYEQSSA